MTAILHLTDLHLEAPGDYAGGDVKSTALPATHHPSRTVAIRNTLEALAASHRVPSFDVVVVTGDIAWQDGEDGWRKFEEVITPLREAGKFPDDDHVVITPGNHDVRWRVPVDDPTHYANFLNYIRAKPYVTPLLDGIDVDGDGAITASDIQRHFLLDLGLGLAIVPVNSSHYCGVYEPLRYFDDGALDNALAQIGGADEEELRKELEAHRLFDIPRISQQQLRAVVNLLARLRQAVADQEGDWRDIVQIAAMHHHTLPVGTSEEFKAFESLTNLGEVRELLASQRFRVLLHGHKHAAGVYWDRIHLTGSPLNSADWHLLVVSGSTIGSAQQGQEELARMVSVEPSRRQRSLAITRVPLVPVGGQLPDPLITERAELWRAEMGPAPVAQLVSGDDADEVYQRVQALFAGLEGSAAICGLLCEIRGPQRAEQLPAGYPEEVPGDDPQERQQWFTEMVKWWQREETRLIDEVHFTHGQRLRLYGEKRVDQLGEAIRLLQNDSGSTRAVISLIDPPVDRIADESRKFPSFSLVHLSIRVTRAGVPHLDCFGFFRKQEMRFWWPINVAELQRIQTTVIERLARADLRPGSILTYAAVAHVGSGVPDVNVTALDRLADEGEDRLWDMTYLLAHPEEIEADAARADWIRVLDDLEPKEQTLPRPGLGLSLLIDSFGRFTRPTSPDAAKAVAARLSDLHAAYAAVQTGGDPNYWRPKISEILAAIREAVGAAPSEASGTIESGGTGAEP